MTQMRFRGGTLLYTGDIGYPEDGRIEAPVRDFTLTVRREFLAVGASFPQQQVPLPPECTASFELETVTISRSAPPEAKALQELARRHPEEYAGLLEGESVIRALGG